MKKHIVYFYGSTKIITGYNSLSEENIRKRNQIVGFEGINVNPELIEYGEQCFLKKRNEYGSYFAITSIYPENITIMPFRYLLGENIIIKHFEDVIVTNEKYIKADSIGFPLIMLKTATTEGYNDLGIDQNNFFYKREELHIKNNWCCFGHYYLYCLKIALKNKGYFSNEIEVGKKVGNLINTTYTKSDGTRLQIHADAGL